MPGVLSAFDERGCVVVDTLRDRWLYLTGEEAWVWQTVEITGSTGHLEDQDDLEALHFFVDTGLLMMEEDTTSIPFTALEPGAYEYETLECGTVIEVPRPSSLLIQRAWITAVPLHRRPMYKIVQRMNTLRDSGHHYLTVMALAQLQTRIINATPWWVLRTRNYNQRSVAIATCLAAHALKSRADLSFGMSHTERASAWWCTVPEGPVGRPDETLAVSTV
jgi:hypothetical protein